MITVAEHLTIDVQCLVARVNQLQDDVNRIHYKVEDALAIWRNCACFGLGDETELEDEDGNPIKPEEVP